MPRCIKFKQGTWGKSQDFENICSENQYNAYIQFGKLLMKKHIEFKECIFQSYMMSNAKRSPRDFEGV